MYQSENIKIKFIKAVIEFEAPTAVMQLKSEA